MSEDVAWLLADITTFEGSLPTGSPSSQLLAFFAYKDMFDEINKLTENINVKFSLYVDDCTFSSLHPIARYTPYLIKNIVRHFGHKINTKKTRLFYPKDYKTVTGCMITPLNELTVKNSHRYEIIKQIPKLKNKELSKDEIDSLFGRIQSSRQVEPFIFNGVKVLISQYPPSP